MIQINESVIRRMVSESLSRILSEGIKVDNLGQKGPLSESDLVDPQVLFAKEMRMAMQIYMSKRKINNESVFGNTLAYKVWKNYYNAMMSKPGKKARTFFGFLGTLYKGKLGERLMGFRVADNFLFGFWTHGYFICAYFAPSNQMGMFNIIKEIGQYNNVVFPITQDMSSMLERMGFIKSSETHDAKWRGKVVTKDVFGTSEQAVIFGMRALDKFMGKK